MSIFRTIAIRWYKLNKQFRHWREPYRTYRPEMALRAELFSSEQMAEHGKQLANRHRLSLYKKSNQLLDRLADNRATLVDCNELLTEMARGNSDQRMTPVAEWLFDNYYLIEEQIHTAQKHLPKKYNRALPQLSIGPSAGLPRVYDLAMEAISHGDGRFDEESLNHIISAYQSITPLALGELWAIPIMLRLALIENIRRVATRVMADWHDRKLAMGWAEKIVETTEAHPKDLVLAVAKMADSGVSLTSSFVAELARCLQGQNIASNLPLTWIEQSLFESNTSIDHLVQIEAQQQAMDQVSISNSMASLRLLSAINWRLFVESMSIVEHILQKDPAHIYPNMDFATRDHYRHLIEKLAKDSKKSEEETAYAVIALAEEHFAKSASTKELTSHVGFYLMDKGLPLLKKSIGTRATLSNALRSFIKRAPFTTYFFAIMALTFLFSYPFFVLQKQSGWGLFMIALFAIPTLLVTGQLANSIINWLVMLGVSPSLLPRLDYSKGIPVESRSAVVIPTIIGHKDDIDELIEGLEVRFLANRNDHLYFGLLTDFLDADLEEKEGDAELLWLTEERILALNRKYPEGEYDRFFLCHRPRRFNASENVWMGYERKRGKLAEFNALLRGSGHDRFTLIVGDLLNAQNSTPLIHYVITLDTDTQLPRDAACQFVGTIAHPLNHAIYNPTLKRITSGYAILQPRVGISLPSSSRSLYAELFGSDAGVDPYTRTVSDVYQDLFHEGSFIGKGIYDVKAFEEVISNRFPENHILSHDLIEGCYARSGLLSDVQLYEEYPAHFSADTKRRHRWIRGDWQLLPWVLPRIPTPQGREKNTLSWLSRWKIVDNLRRTLAPIALIAMLLLGWFGIDNSALWMAIISLVVFGLLLITSLQNALKKPRDIALNHHLTVTLQTLWQSTLRALLGLIWLPYETYYSLDAMIRTLYRITISHKNLLQWNPSREVERSSKNTLFNLYRQMWISPALSIGIFIFLLRNSIVLSFSLPLLILWFASPAIAWWISRPKPKTNFVLALDEQQFLRQLARQTWAFFDHFVGPKGHWLPPDNMQEEPISAVAHRTSPTNMGMSLLAHLGAYDLGYLTAGRLLKRIDHSLTTMSTLERYHSHFYNWYDTQTLEPLAPRYVSTVDSGNLAGHLLTLRPGILALADDSIFSERHFTGLSDTLTLLRKAIIEAKASKDTKASKDAKVQKSINESVLTSFTILLEEGQIAFPKSISSALNMLQKLIDKASEMLVEEAISEESDIAFWHSALVHQCQDLLDELRPFILPDLPNPFDQQHAPNTCSTWREFAALDQNLWKESQQAEVVKIKQHAKARMMTIEEIAQVISDMAIMDFSFLYNKQRDLLTIGYNADSHRIDSGFYDLLASEVRLTHLVTIAQEQLPQESWFALGRHLTRNDSKPVLLSWTGSMFEYLMPMLVMPSFEGTLLDQTCRSAVAHQIEYGRKLGLPWGVSESGYNALDIQLNYQYRAFGVPGLGLKRGLGDDIVIAPYASVLALMVAPKAAYKNMEKLVNLGFSGRFGLYEAIDYTTERLPRGEDHAVIRSYMAHHQGMSLVSLVNVLLDYPMQKRFKSNPQIKATTLLLQERIPKVASEYLHTTDNIGIINGAARSADNKQRVYTSPNSVIPKTQLLSNGRYHVMVNSAGSGYSRHENNAITRWHEDITSDSNGMFCYLRDITSGEFWSNSYQPTLKSTKNYEAIFTDSRAEFRVYERGFDVHTEITVSPEEDIELRRITITNHNMSRRTIELTSYAEVVLAPALSDALHPAFSKLFVQTELHKDLQAIVCTRRPRAKDEAPPWMCHLLVAHDATLGEFSFETDRAQFIGRGRTLVHPAAMDNNASLNLSNSEGSVLDPIVAIRCQITLAAGQSATVDLITGIANSRKNALGLIHKYRDRHLADRVFALAWTHSQVTLRQLNISLFDARLYERMAASILYNNATLRASEEIITANQRNQSGLWGQAISGDLPIVLLQISDSANIELVIQLVQAHSYWRLKGLSVDLIIWNEDHASYRQHLQDLIIGMLPTGTELIDRPGGIFVRPAQLLSREDRILIQSVARIIISDKRGNLSEQVRRRRIEPQLPSINTPSNKIAKAINTPQLDTELIKDSLILSNPYGGFSADGREYVIIADSNKATPAPWSNILTNRDFGTLITESGSAYTWSKNAHEYRLTPWHNDPVSDGSGEAIYIRDEESGHFWSPTILPRRGQGAYITRHGFGYSVFEHIEAGIHTELTVYVALDKSIKFSLLKIHNISEKTRHLSATGYVEWVLGDLRERASMHVITESDPTAATIFAHNAYSMKHANQVTYFDVDTQEATITGDRAEFVGRNGTLQSPAAMSRKHLSGRTGAGLDPCAAIQVNINLAPGEIREIVFRLGAAEDKKSALNCIAQYRGVHKAKETLQKVQDYWRRTLSQVQVKTPDPSINVLANGWLMYQTIASRFWARTGFYQSGGAYGFRDQLQDSMAMVHVIPDQVREYLLLCAAHQFVEGDVQHWWHPPQDHGVRTTCSDDYLWLPMVTSQYIKITGDWSILDEEINYIEGRLLNEGEESYYDQPSRSSINETLYKHCVRAIEHSMRRGVRGLPLIGCGDWNDGMNRIGHDGKGESVWLGFFLFDVLQQFSQIARVKNDEAFEKRCLETAAILKENLNNHGWDGAWYRRAYFDDGTPLGSTSNDECQIDSIAQSWSVLSKVAPIDRQLQAMSSLNERLVRRDIGIIQLFDPPFDRSKLDPGYIKGYVPGVRENGGQYTHAAIWTVMAFAALKDSTRAWELMGMLNPVNHGDNAEVIETYKVEPYVMSADVYAVTPHEGRGGWSWYTGSAGLMYRLIIESLLGLQVQDNTLLINPVLPEDWTEFSLDYRFHETNYHITVRQTASIDGLEQVSIDGITQEQREILLINDGNDHKVEVHYRHG